MGNSSSTGTMMDSWWMAVLSIPGCHDVQWRWTLNSPRLMKAAKRCKSSPVVCIRIRMTPCSVPRVKTVEVAKPVLGRLAWVDMGVENQVGDKGCLLSQGFLYGLTTVETTLVTPVRGDPQHQPKNRWLANIPPSARGIASSVIGRRFAPKESFLRPIRVHHLRSQVVVRGNWVREDRFLCMG